MPPRRRREGASIQARTEEPSSARVRVPARQKASWSLRRCRPSRGGIRGRPRPERRTSRSSRPHRPAEPVTRMPGAQREGHARCRPRTRGSPSLERSGPQPAVPRERGTGAQASVWQVAVRRPPARQRGGEANATGIGWCRRVAGRKPHSCARIERSQGVPARRFRLQKSASGAWVQRSVSPVGNGARGRGPQPPAESARVRRG